MIFQNSSLKTTKMASSKPFPSKASTKKQPTLNTVYKEYGGQQHFMHSYGLKMSNASDVQEAKAIAGKMLKQDTISKAENVSAQAPAKSTTATTSTRKS